MAVIPQEMGGVSRYGIAFRGGGGQVDRRAMGAKLTHFGAAAAANVFRKAKVQRGAARWYCAPEQLDPADARGQAPIGAPAVAFFSIPSPAGKWF